MTEKGNASSAESYEDQLIGLNAQKMTLKRSLEDAFRNHQLGAIDAEQYDNIREDTTEEIAMVQEKIDRLRGKDHSVLGTLTQRVMQSLFGK